MRTPICTLMLIHMNTLTNIFLFPSLRFQTYALMTWTPYSSGVILNSNLLDFSGDQVVPIEGLVQASGKDKGGQFFCVWRARVAYLLGMTSS